MPYAISDGIAAITAYRDRNKPRYPICKKCELEPPVDSPHCRRCGQKLEIKS